MRLRIGTAGWAIPRAVAEQFPAEGSGLRRYAAQFCSVEINSTFYRPHRPQTYARWVDETPPGFRFAVKLPRAITHEARLIGCGMMLAAFVTEVGLLGEKLGPYLIQLPPSLAFDAEVAEAFFGELRALSSNAIVCEPRHASWFSDEAEQLLAAHRVARVAADPARHALGGLPGGWRGLAYWRLHGSPRPYYSAYDAAALGDLSVQLRACDAAECWCVFDNTASGAAAANAVWLAALMNAGVGAA